MLKPLIAGIAFAAGLGGAALAQPLSAPAPLAAPEQLLLVKHDKHRKHADKEAKKARKQAEKFRKRMRKRMAHERDRDRDWDWDWDRDRRWSRRSWDAHRDYYGPFGYGSSYPPPGYYPPPPYARY